MIILDVDLNTFKSNALNKTNQFHIERKKFIELFSVDGNILYRYVYIKKKSKDDLMFIQKELENSVSVINISHVNEPEWRKAINDIISKLNDLIEKK